MYECVAESFETNFDTFCTRRCCRCGEEWFLLVTVIAPLRLVLGLVHHCLIAVNADNHLTLAVDCYALDHFSDLSSLMVVCSPSV